MAVRYRMSTLMLVLTSAAIVLVVIDYTQVVIWVGHFPLQVSLVPAQNREIAEVAANKLVRNEYPEFLKSPRDVRFGRVDWIKGQPLEVQVPCSDRRSIFGRELSYAQYKLFILRILYKDGELEFIPVKIPDGRTRREVTVTIANGKPDA